MSSSEESEGASSRLPRADFEQLSQLIPLVNGDRHTFVRLNPLSEFPPTMGDQTPIHPITEEEDDDPEPIPTTSTASEAAEPDHGPVLGRHLDALWEYSTTLSSLYQVIANRVSTNNTTNTGGFRYLGAFGHAVATLPEVVNVVDRTTRWTLVHTLMGSFALLHPSQVSQAMDLRGSSVFQDIIWLMWLVAENGDREALDKLDQVLRHTSRVNH
ncbi:hypothetical protein FQN54_004518 [Arachnomyces sp. PD_36]|nr:hypothetical protein FQN54_004518 [Arachnomyces sp. PD_36]